MPETHGWSGGLRLRQLGPAPLIEDNSARAKPTTVVNAQAGYRFLERYSATIAMLTVLDSGDNDITYFSKSFLATENCQPGGPQEGDTPDPAFPALHFARLEPRRLPFTLHMEL